MSTTDLTEAEASRVEMFRESFPLPGVNWRNFDQEKLSFDFQPCKIYPEYFTKFRKYRFSVVFTGKYWKVRTSRIPHAMDVLEGFKYAMNDETVLKVIRHVHQSLIDQMEKEKITREAKRRKLRRGESVDLSRSEEELFYSEEDRQIIEKQRQEIWNRMMSPKKPRLI